MKIRNLLEKTDVHTPSGDWKHESPGWMFDEPKWTEEAYNQFMKEEFIQRVKKVFDKLPFDVVIMPINEKKTFAFNGFKVYERVRTKLAIIPSIMRCLVDVITNAGMLFNDSELNLKKLKDDTARFIKSKVKRNNLVLLIASNFQVENNVSVTPWMMAHGISHATEYSKKVNPNDFHETVFGAMRKFCRMTSDAYDLGWKDQLSYDFWEAYDEGREDTRRLPPEYITPYFTFRTARENDFIHSGEFYNESFSQFMVTGRVKLNTSLPPSLGGKRLVNPDAIDVDYIKKLEAAMNDEYAKIVSRLKGKIIITYDE